MFFARFPSGTPPNHHGVGRRRCSRLHAVAAGGAGAPAPAPAAPTGPATAPFVPYNAEAARYLPDSPPGMFLDEAATLATSTFPIKPDALIALAKKFMATEFGPEADALMAESFTFAGPVVGPLNRTDFLKAVRGFNLKDAFPDLAANLHNFRVDPFEPNRVWFINRTVGTNTGKFAGTMAATGKRAECPPQANSIVFDETGKAIHFSVGYALNRHIGNTGGLGGVFALLYAIGKPLPFREARPWKKSLSFIAFEKVGALAQKLNALRGKK